MLEIRRGTAAEYDEIIDFIDYVFSKHNRPHDFPAMYPNLYQRTDESMHALINLYEDGKIIGSVLAHPRTLSVAGKELKLSGIGSVAAHPRMRGKGIMSKLLNYTVEELKKEGVAISMLGGKRARYNHFGYETGGTYYGLGLSQGSVISAFGTDFAKDYTFRAFTREETALILACKEIYEAQPLHCCYSTEAFVLRFYDWNNRTPYAVYDKAGTLLGYLAMGGVRETRSVAEFAFVEGADPAKIFAAFVVQEQQNIQISMQESQFKSFEALLRIGSVHGIGCNSMWKILDWQAVLDAFLTLKSSYLPLEDGTLVLEIAGSGKWEVAVCGNQVSVTDAGEKAADISLSELDAVFTLTGPLPLALLGTALPPVQLRLMRSWFPLPFHWAEADRV